MADSQISLISVTEAFIKQKKKAAYAAHIKIKNWKQDLVLLLIQENITPINWISPIHAALQSRK